MRRRWDGWEWGGFLFTVLAGTGLHFLYGWTGERSWIAGFSAVNESVWEHMKILYVPLFLLSMVQLCFQGRTSSNYLAARAAAVLCGTALIPALYYTYTGALGRGFLAADIGIFLLSAAAAWGNNIQTGPKALAAGGASFWRRWALLSAWQTFGDFQTSWGATAAAPSC